MYYLDFEQIPKHHYQVVLADCPWTYNDRMSGHSFSLDHEYPSLSIDTLKALPVKDIITKDAALFMWVTSPMLPVGLEVMDAWSLPFKTVAFCWSKRTIHGKEAVNLGRWTMGNVELCLLGTKGSPQRMVRNIRQLVIAERGRHSAKPVEVRHRIERLMGDTTRIELFARGEIGGWDAYGNDREGTAEVEMPPMRSLDTEPDREGVLDV